MNYKFKLTGVELEVKGTPIKVGELNVEVTDLEIRDITSMMKEIPSIMREVKSIIEDDADFIADKFLFPAFGEDDDGDEDNHMESFTNPFYPEAEEEEFEELFAKAGKPFVELQQYMEKEFDTAYYNVLSARQKVKVLDWLDWYTQGKPVAEPFG